MPTSIDVFYEARGAGVATYHSRSQVVLADPQDATDADALRMMAEIKATEATKLTNQQKVASGPLDGLSGTGRGGGGTGEGTIGLGNLGTIGHGGGGGSGSGYGRGAGGLRGKRQKGEEGQMGKRDYRKSPFVDWASAW